jgi:hypothetical protein
MTKEETIILGLRAIIRHAGDTGPDLTGRGRQKIIEGLAERVLKLYQEEKKEPGDQSPGSHPHV